MGPHWGRSQREQPVRAPAAEASGAGRRTARANRADLEADLRGDAHELTKQDVWGHA